MSEFWKKAIIRASIGFVLGILVGLGFLSITGVGTYYVQKGADGLALYLALSGLLGAVGMGGTTIYSLEHWGLLRDRGPLAIENIITSPPSRSGRRRRRRCARSRWRSGSSPAARRPGR